VLRFFNKNKVMLSSMYIVLKF